MGFKTTNHFSRKMKLLKNIYDGILLFFGGILAVILAMTMAFLWKKTEDHAKHEKAFDWDNEYCLCEGENK